MSAPSLDHVKSLVLVFAMPGCGACEDYIPRLTRLVKGFQAYKVPFVLYTAGEIPRGAIPVLIYNAAETDPGVQALADQYKIEGLPTTILLTRTTHPARLEGAISDEQIHEVLTAAAIANR